MRPHVETIRKYVCARDSHPHASVLLDANENSLGPPISVTLCTSASGSASQIPLSLNLNLNRYPDPYNQLLKQTYADFRSLPAHSHNRVFLGVGSDECIDILLRVFCSPRHPNYPSDAGDAILITPPTYGMYSVCASINHVDVLSVPLITTDHAFQLNMPQMIHTLKTIKSIKIVFLCSPGNPTSRALSRTDILTLLSLKEYTGLIVVDEAYIDFVRPVPDTDPLVGTSASMATLVDTYPNLCVLQTMSKSFGLAAIRLGFAISSPDIIKSLTKFKAPYNISSLTSPIAQAALSSLALETVHGNLLKILQNRQSLIAALSLLLIPPSNPHHSRPPGLTKIIPTDANFVLLQFSKDGKPSNDIAKGLYTFLATECDVVVRFRGEEVGCLGCLRVTVGSPAENTMLLEVLGRKLQELIL